MVRTCRALILINPNARRRPDPKQLAQGIAWLAERGWIVAQQATSSSQEIAGCAARAASEGLDVVVACGGDGTLHDALPGLVGTQTALAHIPSGTANVWAGEARLPRNPFAALRLLEEGDRVRIDTGSANGRPFLLMASLGLDSIVADRVNGRLKRWFSFFPYLAYAALELPRYRGVEAELTLDGYPLASPSVAPVVAVLVGNTRSYGGVLQVAAIARADDGLLDVCVLHGAGRRRFIDHLLRTALGRHLGHPQVTYRRARHVTVSVSPPWPVQLDGEVASQTPVAIACVPNSLTVVVPPGLRTPLWGQAMP